jgi:hypothetical protein
MKAIKTVFYSDPSHGWLRVPKKILSELRIEKEISSFSYMKGKYVYLEEDADLTLFAERVGNFDEWKELMSESYSDSSSAIRRYSRYEIVDEDIVEKVRESMFSLFDPTLYGNRKAVSQIKRATIDTLRFWNEHYKFGYSL